MNRSLPTSVRKYFWGDDLNQLNWNDHQHYITETLLEKGDSASISWLFKQSDKHTLYKQLPSFKLTQKSANFWKIYLE